MAPATIEECFHSMVTARRIAETFRMVVMVLTDANLATGVQPFRRPVPDAAWQGAPLDLATPPEGLRPYDWDPRTGLSRRFVPGMQNGAHTVTGLAHDERSKVAYDTSTVQRSHTMRSRKLAVLQHTLRPPTVYGDEEGDLLVVGWGSTKGAIEESVDRARAEGLKVSSLHLTFLSPMQPGIKEIFQRFANVMTVEINYSDDPADPFITEENRRRGQLALLLQGADTGGRGLLDAGAGRAPPARRHPARHGKQADEGRCRMSAACSLLGCAVDDDRVFDMEDYEGPIARWCPGCGDHSVLTAVERLLTAEQLKPENTVFVSGIGCSSRFPHYLKTYGFHGLHGRALPVATGVKLNRPELDVFVVMGDGDCTSIGAGHWLHAIRYNMDLMALMLDNNIYGLTKKQTSPTTPQGFTSNTQPRGSYLPALNPIEATLGITNASFVAQTAEWMPSHLYATLQAAYSHKGFAFVRILQRCPVFTSQIFAQAVRQPDLVELLVHEDGVHALDLQGPTSTASRTTRADLDGARRLAETADRIRLGVFYRDESRTRYEETAPRAAPPAAEKLALLNQELDRYAV